MRNVTSETAGIRLSAPVFPWVSDNNEHLLLEYQGKPTTFVLGNRASAPIRVGSRFSLFHEFPEVMTLKSCALSVVFIDIGGSLIAFDVRGNLRNYACPDLVGDNRGLRLSYWADEFTIDINTVDYFGARPNWIRELDPVTRPAVGLAVDLDAHITINISRMTHGHVEFVSTITDEPDGDREREMRTIEYFKKLEYKLVAVVFDIEAYTW